jgi:hypothetical protein
MAFVQRGTVMENSFHISFLFQKYLTLFYLVRKLSCFSVGLYLALALARHRPQKNLQKNKIEKIKKN